MSSDSVIVHIEKPSPAMRGLLVRPHPASQHLPFSVPLTASAGSAPYRNPLDTSKTPVIEAGSATLAILCFCPAASTHPSYLRPRTRSSAGYFQTPSSTPTQTLPPTP